MNFDNFTKTLITSFIQICIPGPPDPVTDCRSGEPDPFIVSVSCAPGYDGGLGPSFTAELYTDPEHRSLASTVTNTRPEFSVYNLPPGTRCVM